MSTILPRSTSVFTLLLLLACGSAAHAQESHRGTRINWPRTFGGQPDFEFARADVVKDATDAATKQGLPAPSFPTLEELLEDTTLTPLMLEELPVENVSATATVSVTDVSQTGFIADILPAMDRDEKIDLTEFRTMLVGALAQQVRTFRLSDGMDASYLLRQLKLQAVVRSPVAYATINETRYKVGDTITLPLMAGPSDMAQINLLNGLKPPSESMTPEAADQYQAVVEDVIKELAAKKTANPAEYQKVFDLPVTLMEIQPRTVIVQFQGQKHELSIPFLY
jgi:hypothetical protein